MEPGTHDIREHIELEEVIKAISNADDHDTAISIQPHRNGNILAWGDGASGYDHSEGQPTLLKALYEAFPECYCRFAEWENSL